jgi:hypothetical protein
VPYPWLFHGVFTCSIFLPFQPSSTHSLHSSSFSLCHYYQVILADDARLQICSLPITLSPACAFFNISFISARYIVNSRGLRGQPCLTPFVVSNHSPSFSPTFTLFFVLAYISSYKPFAYSSLSLSQDILIFFFIQATVFTHYG